MFFTDVKNFFKKYWFLLLGTIVGFFLLISPKKSKKSEDKQNYDNRVLGQNDVLNADAIRDEKIAQVTKEAEQKLQKIQNEKEQLINDLKDKKQEELTERLSKRFNLDNMDN